MVVLKKQMVILTTRQYVNLVLALELRLCKNERSKQNLRRFILFCVRIYKY